MRNKEWKNHAISLKEKRRQKGSFSNNLKCKLALSGKQELKRNVKKQHILLGIGGRRIINNKKINSLT